MMRVIALSLLGLSLLFSMKPNQERGWRGIVPLHSTRLDFEKLIGPPNTPDGSMYDPGVLDPTVDRIFVEYSTGDCSKKRNGGYNVPIGTVIQMGVTWSERRNFSELQIDKSKLEKSRDSEIPEIVYFENMDEGIIYTVEEGKLKRTDYFSSSKDSQLRCPPK